MAYTDFTLESAEARLGLTAGLGDLFPGLQPAPVPTWLSDVLDRGREAAALVSEKSRSEFIVAPVLLAARALVAGDVTIYSGQRLDVDAALGLVGECDYILARTAPVPRLRAPLVTVLEAKRGDIELGLGQCAAQMAAARLFNERAGAAVSIYAAVTTGEDWQFLRLDGSALTLHTARFYLVNLGIILAALASALQKTNPAAVTAPASA